ncbi:MAG: hypothetical protein ACM3X9_08575 [Bacillota bacterium]
MEIDGNEQAKVGLKLSRNGNIEGSIKADADFLEKIKASGIDTCSCDVNCVHHGNCFECVILHRGHGDHLPKCFWNIINTRLEQISDLTEGSFKVGKGKK